MLKLQTKILAKPYHIINCSIKQGIKPDTATTASAFPIDKIESNKNDIFNYRPVSTLNIFSKLYQKISKLLNNYFLLWKNIFLFCS